MRNIPRFTNGVRDAILPGTTMCVKYFIQKNKVVRIIVDEGTNKPYCLKSKGLKPNDVYQLSKKCDIQPIIVTMPNAFKIVLPNMNEAEPPMPDESAITYQMHKLMDYISDNCQATDTELEEFLDVKYTRLYNLTREMK